MSHTNLSVLNRFFVYRLSRSICLRVQQAVPCVWGLCVCLLSYVTSGRGWAFRRRGCSGISSSLLLKGSASIASFLPVLLQGPFKQTWMHKHTKRIWGWFMTFINHRHNYCCIHQKTPEGPRVCWGLFIWFLLSVKIRC